MDKGKLKVKIKSNGAFDSKRTYIQDENNRRHSIPTEFTLSNNLNDKDCEFKLSDEGKLVNIVVDGEPIAKKDKPISKTVKKCKEENQYFLPTDSCFVLEKNQLTNKNIDNFALRLNKFMQRKSFDDKGKDKLNDVSLFIAKQDSRIDNYYNSVKKIHPTHNRSFSLKTNWRLAIGIGTASIYETSISLHHIYGIPYIPAQSIKGSFRSYIIENYFDSDEKTAFNDKGFIAIFGSNSEQGNVIFFDAFSKQPKLQLDIMNNHYQNYYGKNEAPTDTQNPNPINFLTIVNTEFRFMLTAKENKSIATGKFEGKKILDVVATELKQSLQFFGIGAKTAVGYGCFENN